MFAGCIEWSSSDVTSEAESTVGDSLRQQALSPSGLAEIPYDDSDLWQDQNSSCQVTLVQQRRWNTQGSGQEQGIVEDELSGIKVLSWSRIDNRQELIADLQNTVVDQRVLSQMETDAGLLLACWLHWREAICEHLVGDFAFAIYETESGNLFLGRDHLGVKPLYIYHSQDCFVFATSLAVLCQCHTLNLQRSEAWMARYMMSCSEDWTLTAYQPIKKLPPAHCMSVKAGNVNSRAYFQFSSQLAPNLSDQGYVDEYLRLFNRAVSDRLDSDYPLAAELSGGLDSSSIAAIALKQIDALFSYALVRSKDEPACIASVNRYLSMPPTRQMSPQPLQQKDVQALEQEALQTLGAPVEQDIALVHQSFYEDAQQKGIRTLLSGFGGDEFTTSYASLVRNELWQQGAYLKWLRRFRGGLFQSKLRALKWLCQHVLGIKSFSSRQLSQQASIRRGISPLCRQTMESFGLDTLLKERAAYDSRYSSLNDFTLGNRWSPSMTTRLENCTLMAARYGLEYRWPLLDIRLIQFFLSVPAEQKLGPGGLGRYLHRRAVQDLLPADIVWRDKYMGVPLRQKEQPLNSDLNTIARPDSELPAWEQVVSGPFSEIIDPDAYARLSQATNSGISYKHHRRVLINRIGRLLRWK